ncbi:MAG: AI-2E family transporter [Anaerolineae bacterium]|nr:AI-2E family transporter [Anaerolineae bacterium]
MNALTGNSVITPFVRFVLLVAGLVVVIAGMKAANNLLNAIFLGILLTTICMPLKHALQRRGVKPFTAFVITFLISILVGVGVLLFIVVSIVQVVGQLPRYEASLNAIADTFRQQLILWGLDPEALLNIGVVPVETLFSVIRQGLTGALSVVSLVVLAYLFLLYLLWESDDIARRAHIAFGGDSPFIVKTTQFITSSQRYILSRTVLGAGIAALQTVLMLAMGVDFALLWGFLSLICNYIPNVGFIIGIVPPAAILLLEQGIAPTIIFIAIYAIINSVIENFVTPRYIGSQVNLSPLFTFSAVIFWTFVLGPMGAILGVPATLFIKQVLIDTDFSMSGISALMSVALPSPPPAETPS